jgi:hypothetical protein
MDITFGVQEFRLAMKLLTEKINIHKIWIKEFSSKLIWIKRLQTIVASRSMDYFTLETCKQVEQGNLSKNKCMNNRTWTSNDKNEIKHTMTQICSQLKLRRTKCPTSPFTKIRSLSKSFFSLRRPQRSSSRFPLPNLFREGGNINFSRHHYTNCELLGSSLCIAYGIAILKKR